MISFHRRPPNPAGSLVQGTDLRERPIMCFYTYRRRTPKKVTVFFQNFLKIWKKPAALAANELFCRAGGTPA